MQIDRSAELLDGDRVIWRDQNREREKALDEREASEAEERANMHMLFLHRMPLFG
jgi:hypothetical protein